MTPPQELPSRARWERLKTLFHGALDQPAGERERWLREAADGDLELLHEAQALVEAHQTAGDFLEAPVAIDPADLLEDLLRPGARVGPYTIVEEIGRGGMGVVYLAEDERLGRRVALKSLPPAAAGDPAFRARLRREARAAATISHPNVAVVYTLDEVDGRLFIASEYVRGRTLREEIARAPLEPRRALRIAADIARALAAAHDAGVVHRDLKPENVILTSDDAVKVVDFGIAHVEGADATRLTREGALVGTPAYMAPEQLLGGPVDARADIFSCGVVLAEMVTGQHPLGRSPRATLPALVAPIVARCLEPDPGARFGSARELLDALTGTSAPGHPGTQAPGNPTRWWWEFHQGAAALVYWLMVVPAWNARGLIGGATGRAFFIATLAAVIVAANLRLHLWFTSRFYPRELKWLRPRVSRWVQAADWLFAASLAAGSLLVGEAGGPLDVLLMSVAIGAAVAFLVIEPATTRAAFRGGAAAILLLSLAAGACSRAEQREPAEPEALVVPVAVQPAEVGSIRPVLHASGVMTPAAGAEFLAFAPEPARVVEVTKKEGDAVASGELLVRFDIPGAAGDVARQRAELARARADLENARMNQARSRDLAQRGLIPRRDQEDADRAFADAQSAVSRAELAVAAAESAADRAIVRAPFAGIVARRLHEPGDLVQGAVTDPVLRLVDPRRLEVSASVPVADLPRVLPGTTARLVGVPGGVPIPLTVASRPGPGGAGAAGTVTVRLSPLAPAALAVDTPVQVDIDLDERTNAVLVPPEAVIRTGGTAAVFVASGGRAQRRTVTTGIADDEKIEITSGVRAGELVITRGHTGLQDGAPINVAISAR